MVKLSPTTSPKSVATKLPATPKPKATPTVAPKTKATPVKTPEKEVTEAPKPLYPHVEIALFIGDKALVPSGVISHPLGVEHAKSILGWTIPEGEGKFIDPDFTNTKGQTIKCSRLTMQRPFKRQKSLGYAHEILEGNFQFNGEPILIGSNGACLDGMHRLTALVFANELWEENPTKYYKWKTSPTIDVVLIAGIPEEVKRVNTINTGMSRTTGDSLYAANVFKNSDKKLKKKICNSAGHAISMLWYRTGANVNAFSSKRTHAESLDFLQRHPKLGEYLEKTFEWDRLDGSHSILSPGYSAAFLYLMAVTATENTKEGEGYHDTVMPTEALLDFSFESKALEYWEALYKREDWVQPVTDLCNDLILEGRPLEEKVAAIVLGWRSLISSEGGYVNPEEVTLESLGYTVNGDGVRKLSRTAFVGGIDTAGT